MGRRWRWLAVGAGLAGAAYGCGTTESRIQEPGGIAWTPMDRLDLQESDTLYVGRPVDLAVDPLDGSYYVADGFGDRVIRFDRAGRPLRIYGRKGTGPGEIVNVGTTFALDTFVVAADVTRGTLNLFGRGSGAFRGQVRAEGTVKSAVVEKDGVWLGSQSLARRTSVSRWVRGADTLTYLVPLPASYLRSDALSGIYTIVSLASWADTLLIGHAGLNRVSVVRTDGRPIERIDLPVRRRRGVPPDLVERLEKLPFAGKFSLSSVLFYIHRLPDGGFVFVHFDQRIDPSRNITAKVYATLLSADRRRACADIRVPVADETQPRAAFRGDTLLLLEQTTTAGAPVTHIRRFLVSGRGCSWEPVHPAPAGSPADG